MAKPTGGLLAFSARGSVAKTIVFSSWRGRQYVRQHVIPRNPRSTAQTSTRTVFTFLQEVWKQLAGNAQDVWTLAAQGQPLTNRNAFTKANLATLRPLTSLAGILFSNGAKGGIAPDSITVTPGSGSLTVAVVAPTPPTGWSVVLAEGVVMKDGDPHLPATNPESHYASDASSPYSLSFTGLASGDTYYGGAWLKWMKPDGSFAYGVQLDITGVPS